MLGQQNHSTYQLSFFSPYTPQYCEASESTECRFQIVELPRACTALFPTSNRGKITVLIPAKRGGRAG